MGPDPRASCANHPAEPAVETCGRCRRWYCASCLVSLAGQRLCGACKTHYLGERLASYVIPAEQVPYIQAPGVPAGPAAPSSMAVCAVHPAQPASVVCERCGDFACALCATPFQGRFYCLSCFELQWERGGLTGGRVNTYALTSMVLGLLGVTIGFCSCPANLLLGILAVIFGCVGLSQIARNPGQTGRGQAIAGISTGFASLAISVGFLVWFALH